MFELDLRFDLCLSEVRGFFFSCKRVLYSSKLEAMPSAVTEACYKGVSLDQRKCACRADITHRLTPYLFYMGNSQRAPPTQALISFQSGLLMLCI